MIPESRQSDNQRSCVTLLRTTNRYGMEMLIDWLHVAGYFTSPASTKSHGAEKGGLAEHALNVYFKLRELLDQVEDTTPTNSIVIAAILHDVCKVGAYTGHEGAYTRNKSHPAGHASQSIKIIKRFIVLTDLEEAMIRYHMGSYGTLEHNDGYTIDELHQAYNKNRAINIMHIADQMAAHIESAE